MNFRKGVKNNFFKCYFRKYQKKRNMKGMTLTFPYRQSDTRTKVHDISFFKFDFE